MNVQEFKRWAEGQRIVVPAIEHAATDSSEQIAQLGEPRAEVKAGTEGSQSRPRRFLGTLRWGK